MDGQQLPAFVFLVTDRGSENGPRRSRAFPRHCQIELETRVIISKRDTFTKRGMRGVRKYCRCVTIPRARRWLSR